MYFCIIVVALEKLAPDLFAITAIETTTVDPKTTEFTLE